MLNSQDINTSSSVPRNYATPYFEVFLFSVIAAWLPFKLFAYLMPFLSIAWFIIRTDSGKSLIRFIICLLLFGVMLAFYYSLYHVLDEVFIVQNAFLSFLTYGSFLFFLILPANRNLVKVNYLKYLRVIKIVIIIQSVLGITQIMVYIALHNGNFDSAAGDIVQGTLNPLSFLYPDGGFNNQIYSINLLVLLLFYVPYSFFRRKDIWVCALGLLAILFASVWHVVISAIAACGIILLIFSRTVARISVARIVLVLSVVFISGIGILIQPKNFRLVSYYYDKITTIDSPKAIVTVESFTKLPEDFPWVIVTGLGPGQYTSRASLIGSGRYFGNFENPRKLFILKPKSSEAFDEYIFPYWKEVATNPLKFGNSTMSRPFYSILSIMVEFGFVFFAFITAALIFLIVKRRKLFIRRLNENDRMKSMYGLAGAIMIVFYAIVSLFENYLEVTQAVFPGILLYIYFNDFFKKRG